MVLRRGMFVNTQFLTSTGIEKKPLPYLFDNHLKIGASQGTSHEEFTRKYFPNAEFIGYTDKNKMYIDVANQNITACLYDESRYG